MGMRVARAIVMATLLVQIVAGCSGQSALSTRSTDVPQVCDVRHLDVSVDADLAIHVRNAGRSTCRLAGTPAVKMQVGRIDGELPTTDVALAPGQEFIQPQIQVAGAWACAGPISAGLPGKGFWTVTVQGLVVHPVDPDMQVGRQVVNCWVVTLPHGHVSPKP